MQVLLWAIGILVTIQLVAVGALWSRLWTHVVECKGVGEKVARIDADVERMKQDIGTHETGLRGELHRTASMTTQHELRLLSLERK